MNILARDESEERGLCYHGGYDYIYFQKSCVFCDEQGSGRPTKRHSVRFHRNSCEKVDVGEDSALICGIDGTRANEPISAEVVTCLQGQTKGQAALILSHSPLVFDLIKCDQDVLVVAGDTHGGQVPLPSWVWKFLGYEKNAKYERGWFEEGQKKMYVSKGYRDESFSHQVYEATGHNGFSFSAS